MIATGESALKQTQTPAGSSWKRGAFFFLLLLLPGSLLFAQDAAVWQWLREHGARPWRDLAGHISDWGDWPWLMAGGLLLFAAAKIWRAASLARLALLMMLASSLGGLAANTVRLSVGRARPNARVEPGWHGLHDAEGRWIITNNRYHSFPSGHTATTFGFFAVPLFQRRRAGVLLLLPGVIMAFCRMLIGAHFLSDTFYGAWFGLLAAWLVVRYGSEQALVRRLSS